MILANGDIDEDVILKYHQQDIEIIALDGVVKKLCEKHIQPAYVLGDFDSLEEMSQKTSVPFVGEENQLYQTVKEFSQKIIPTFSEKGLVDKLSFNETIYNNVTFVFAICQEYTDLEKGILFAQSKGYKNIVITGALGGGRTDHSLGNLSLLKRFHSSENSIMIETKKEIVQFLKNEEILFSAPLAGKFGILGFPKATISSNGLVWDMQNYEIEFGVRESTSNIVNKEKVTVKGQGDAIMVRPR